MSLDKISVDLMTFTIVSHFHWPRQTHQLTMKSVHYVTVVFYSIRQNKCRFNDISALLIKSIYGFGKVPLDRWTNNYLTSLSLRV